MRIYYLEQFIELCRENDIKLFICITPKYSLMKREFYDIPKNIAERYGVPVFDYHDHQLFLGRPEYFKDNMHLCDAGARLFTSIFAHDLKEYLTNGQGQTPQHL